MSWHGYHLPSTQWNGYMPQQSPFTILLTTGEHELLDARVRRYTSSYRDVIRAKIVLYAAQGMQNKEIAARLDTSAQIVSKWRKRFFEQRFDGLQDVSRRGRPRRFSPRGGHPGQGGGV